MEPGHEDREYVVSSPDSGAGPCHASMEPGHEDREYEWVSINIGTRNIASMEPGHEDREY